MAKRTWTQDILRRQLGRAAANTRNDAILKASATVRFEKGDVVRRVRVLNDVDHLIESGPHTGGVYRLSGTKKDEVYSPGDLHLVRRRDDPHSQ